MKKRPPGRSEAAAPQKAVLVDILLKELEMAIRDVDSFAWIADERTPGIRWAMNDCVKAISGNRLLMRKLAEITGITVQNKAAVKKAIYQLATQLAATELTRDFIESGRHMERSR